MVYWITVPNKQQFITIQRSPPWANGPTGTFSCVIFQNGTFGRSGRNHWDTGTGRLKLELARSKWNVGHLAIGASMFWTGGSICWMSPPTLILSLLFYPCSLSSISVSLPIPTLFSMPFIPLLLFMGDYKQSCWKIFYLHRLICGSRLR